MLTDAPPGRYLSLGGLGAAAVADLAADAVGTAPGQGLLAGLAGAAGNPLFVTEMLAALAQEGMIETAGGRAEVEQTALPPTLRLTILRRLSFLSDDMLQALRFASILGASFTVEDDGDRLRFRHDVIRDAIYEDMPATIRHGLHREAGQRLARTGAPALQVAEHLARGAARGDTEAVGWLSRAAREAAAKSPEVAAALLGRAAPLRRGWPAPRLLASPAGSGGEGTWGGQPEDAPARHVEHGGGQPAEDGQPPRVLAAQVDGPRPRGGQRPGDGGGGHVGRAAVRLPPLHDPEHRGERVRVQGPGPRLGRGHRGGRVAGHLVGRAAVDGGRLDQHHPHPPGGQFLAQRLPPAR